MQPPKLNQGDQRGQKKEINHPDNDQLFEIAFTERKKINLQQIRDNYTKRTNFYKTRQKILNQLQQNLYEKYNFTKQFAKDIIKYFQDYLDLFSVYFKGMAKNSLEKKNKQNFIYESVYKAVMEMCESNEKEVEKVKSFTTWIQKILLPAIKTAYNLYTDQVKQAKKVIINNHTQNLTAKDKQVKSYQKLQSGSDLMERELNLLQKIKQSDKQLQTWGTSLYEGWKKIIEFENQLKRIIQLNVLDFCDRFAEVFHNNPAIDNLVKFWKNPPQSPPIGKIFLSFLGQQEVKFIVMGAKNKKFLPQFQKFINLQDDEERVGNILPIIQILQVKKFKCKLKKTQRNWIDIKLIFTIENNLLFIELQHSKLYLRLLFKGLKAKRISQNIAEISGTQEGMIFNSTRKEQVHFDTIDELEEFFVFIENKDKNK